MMWDIISIQYIALSMLGLLGALWILFTLSSHTPVRDRKEKSRMYASGMDMSPSQAGMPSSSYYSYMKRFLGTDYLAKLHSGKLSTYNAWIIIGTAIIMAAMLILW